VLEQKPVVDYSKKILKDASSRCDEVLRGDVVVRGARGVDFVLPCE
jgi:hypothetical protein